MCDGCVVRVCNRVCVYPSVYEGGSGGVKDPCLRLARKPFNVMLRTVVPVVCGELVMST